MAVWWCIGGRVDVFGVGRHMQDRARLMNWGLGRDSGVQAGQCGGRLGNDEGTRLCSRDASFLLESASRSGDS